MSNTITTNLFSKLSDRESEIAHLILEGMKTNDIASQLNVKSNTISTLKKRLFEKVGVESSIQLYKLAIKEGVIA
ncbi:MAG: Response regulator UvrY [Bacteroidota bacterium]|jgi:DNA-binding NarL/FixJ family response regulator